MKILRQRGISPIQLKKEKLPGHLIGDLYLGDNLELMRSLPSNIIDLIYIDPPRFSQKDYEMESKIDPGEIRKFSDKWESINEYLVYLYIRLKEMKRLLKNTGSIYVHLDDSASFDVKSFIMDRLFSRKNFRNDIIWCYKGGGRPNNKFANKHDHILFYTKSDNYTFNLDDIRIPYSDNTKECNVTRASGNYRYEPNKKGKIPEDWWIIPPLNSNQKEFFDYPTQKPMSLLDKIIRSSSNPGDMIADFFIGSGTTIVVANLLGRKWIACDKSVEAIRATKARLFGNKSIKDSGYQKYSENAGWGTDKELEDNNIGIKQELNKLYEVTEEDIDNIISGQETEDNQYISHILKQLEKYKSFEDYCKYHLKEFYGIDIGLDFNYIIIDNDKYDNMDLDVIKKLAIIAKYYKLLIYIR